MTCHTGYKTNKGRVKAESEADWAHGLGHSCLPLSRNKRAVQNTKRNSVARVMGNFGKLS